MSTLSGLLESIAEHLRALWPFAIVAPWEQGVKLYFGRVAKLCDATNGLRGSGLHWYAPAVGTVHIAECNVEVFETEPQTVRTQDGVDVTFTLGVQCRIERLDLFYVQVGDNLKATVGDVVRTAASELAMKTLLADFGAAWAEGVQKEAQQRMYGWGVKLRRVGLLTFTTSPTLRLITSRQGDAPLAGVGAA